MPQSRGTSSKETSQNNSGIILSLLKEAATFAPFAELKQAACVALLILQTIQAVNENKEAYERLGEEAGGLIAAIWRSYRNAKVPNQWLSADMREILEDSTHTLENISSFVQDHYSKNKAMRAFFSRAAAVKINEYREDLRYVTQKFELQSHIKINEVLIQLMRQNDQLSEHIFHRDANVMRALETTAREARDQDLSEKIFEEELEKVKQISALEQLKQDQLDCLIRDEQRHSDELKKIEQATKDRQSELESLRAAADAVELTNRLKRAREEEMAELRYKNAVEENIQRRTIIHEQSSGEKKSSNRQEDVEEEVGWTITVEEATSQEEEVRQSVKRNSKEKKKPSKPPKRRSVASDASTYDDEDDFQSVRSSKTRTGSRKPSSSSPRVEDDSTHEDDDFASPSPRKSPKAKRSASGSPPRAVDGLKFQVLEFGCTPYGSKFNSHSDSPMYTPSTHSNPSFPTYGPPFSPPISPYGYGVGAPGTIINSGVGNITNTRISNVGNDHSVKKIYHK